MPRSRNVLALVLSVVVVTSFGVATPAHAAAITGVWNHEFCVTAVNGALESGKSNCVVALRPAGS